MKKYTMQKSSIQKSTIQKSTIQKSLATSSLIIQFSVLAAIASAGLTVSSRTIAVEAIQLNAANSHAANSHAANSHAANSHAANSHAANNHAANSYAETDNHVQAGKHNHDLLPSELSEPAQKTPLTSVGNTIKKSEKGDGHDHEPDNSEVNEAEHDDAMVLSEHQQKLAGIRVVNLSNSKFNIDSVAPAAIVVDRDRTISIAPQLDVRVLARHVVPGQEVIKGQPLLTLGGFEVAKAQADFITNAAEWGRMQRMVKNTLSESQLLVAQVQAELSRANLEALKMTPAQISGLTANPKAIGQYQLLAPISGRVQQDVAMLGQVSAGGAPLMQLTDESHLWVEAQLSAMQADGIESGDKAMVKVGKVSIEGTIIGRSHELNPITRTEQVLVSINNTDYGLHAGQFAELYLPNALNGGVVLPDAALTRGGDGDWQVFIQVEDGFEAVEVEVVERQRGMNMVTGLAPNSQVVISGAFLLASELAKAGFDIHNH
ncbi:efflux RND transporter periplasmic adaptor subunit [Shewanella donghaensis]|uniref:efflux RND transporter periplasmic adaptor subunit n=1 Tax=Shewanella donghaensis TaxID=238836 RepID=UPI001D05179B|nr:efflux RND transporter periplasmic adaptor subunit [Shewanella donghaensis]